MSGLSSKDRMKFHYETYRLDPDSPSFPFLAGKYAALSLRALTTDPHSFGMVYSIEAAFTPGDWMHRLSRPRVHVFVCVAHPVDLSPRLYDIEHGAWVGMVTQIGPTPKDEYWVRETGGEEPLEDALETKWHQTATWLDPAHRGRGLAKQLVEAGVEFAAESVVGSVRQARVRAFIGPDNEVSISLYAKCGFPHVGLITRYEAMIQNGNAEYQLQGGKVLSDAEMHSRGGIMMERVVTDSERETNGHLANA